MTHLPPEMVAAYVDDTLSDAERRHADVHLTACTECRAELREVRRLVLGGRRRFGPRLVGGTALAAAAVAALVLLPRAEVGGPTTAPTGATSPFRSDGGGGATLVEIEPLEPEIEESGEVATMSLLWRPVTAGSTYRVSLTDAGGATIWSGETTDSVVAVPNDVGLDPGGTYYWFVDATLPDGEAASTGVQTVVIR